MSRTSDFRGPTLRTVPSRTRALRAHPVAWLTLAVAIGAVEYLAGPHLNAGVLYLVPLALAAWYGPLWVALVVALVTPVLRWSFVAFDLWESPAQLDHAVINTLLRIGALLLVGLLIHRARQARDLEREVAALRGMLPICMYCKQIKDGDGRWHAVEQYIGARTDAAFTHQVCPVCEGGHRKVFLG